MKPIIEIKNLSAGYDGRTVLHDVNLSIYERDFLGIIGPNGGGKTTLIKCILGLLKPTGGKLYSIRPKRPLKRLLQNHLPKVPGKVLPQNPLPPRLSASIQHHRPEVSYFRGRSDSIRIEHTKVTHFPIHSRTEGERQTDYFRMGLEGLEHRSIGQLSGGQLQRALLGRAIISDPAVLILDEPSTYIDKRFEARLYELLAEINKGCAIILVSHDIGTVLQQVKSIACVNETLDYHPDTGVTTEWLERNFNCPIELLGHGTLPHRVLGEHHHHH
ncbi:metal ABC transporter ATP-binding protein [Bacteroides sp. CR5/BHMF/2]|nr:metal ABC transporter ATP-binding protein [Bacteroides sp. CR5/BHMF/2]